MLYDPQKPYRRSIRLKEYNYTQPGAYFVTVCTQNRECLFGEIINGQMLLNDAGRMIQSVWNELPQHYPGVDVDAFVVMPNHIHGIIVLTPVGAGPRACPPDSRACPPDSRACPEQGQPQESGQPQGVAPTMSLSDVVHRFKSLTTTRYRHGVSQNGWRSFSGRLWQRNYYERIIRNEDELNLIRCYIRDNPIQWETDENNPNRSEETPDAH